jgi:hypothetical protein
LKYRDNPNFKMVWYEEMKKNLITVIRDMSKFVGYHLTELKVITILIIINFQFILDRIASRVRHARVDQIKPKY